MGKKLLLVVGTLLVLIIVALALWLFALPIVDMTVPLPAYPQSLPVYRTFEPVRSEFEASPAELAGQPIDHMTALKPVAQAYRELKNERRRYSPIGTLWISVDAVEITYWRQQDGAEWVYYPVYVFKGETSDTLPFLEKKPGIFYGWVEASGDSSIDFPAME